MLLCIVNNSKYTQQSGKVNKKFSAKNILSDEYWTVTGIMERKLRELAEKGANKRPQSKTHNQTISVKKDLIYWLDYAFIVLIKSLPPQQVHQGGGKDGVQISSFKFSVSFDGAIP